MKNNRKDLTSAEKQILYRFFNNLEVLSQYAHTAIKELEELTEIKMPTSSENTDGSYFYNTKKLLIHSLISQCLGQLMLAMKNYYIILAEKTDKDLRNMPAIIQHALDCEDITAELFKEVTQIFNRCHNVRAQAIWIELTKIATIEHAKNALKTYEAIKLMIV